MRRSLILCAFLVVAGLVAGAGGAGLTAADDMPQATSAYEELLQDGLTQGLPGVALLVDRGGQDLFNGAAGVASIEEQTPARATDRFRIYSIAKAFTAIVVLQLVDEGVLSLDDTVTRWLDDPVVLRIPHVDDITLRQLLTHSSGIYDFADDVDSPFWDDAFTGPTADWTKMWTLPEMLAYADGANHSPYFAPGEGHHYSNTGYLLLGMIVEAATGNAYGDELQTRILDPLGLEDTFLVEGPDMPEGTVSGYQALGGDLLNVSVSNLSWIRNAGGMVSTLADLERFAQAVYGGELLSPESFAAMFTFVPTANPAKGQGMGVYRIVTPNGELVGMDGQGPGFEASMMRLPAEDVTVILLANMAPASFASEEMRDEAFRIALTDGIVPAATPAS